LVFGFYALTTIIESVTKLSNARATATVQDLDTDDVFNVQGTSDTLAEAKDELKAKLAMMSNIVVLGVSESAAGTIGDYPVHAVGGDGDATLTLRIGTDRATTRSINLRNVTSAVKDTIAQDGSINVGDDLITAFGTAYRDAEGAGGYTVIRGNFHK
jgi:hypothetical protein